MSLEPEPIYWLNPVGLMPDITICESVWHQWESRTFKGVDPAFQNMLEKCEVLFRECGRCRRFERNGKHGWEVAKIEPSTA